MTPQRALERSRRGICDLSYLRVDLRVAERRTPCYLKPTDPALTSREVVGSVGGQREKIAVLRPRNHIQQQRRVANGSCDRPDVGKERNRIRRVHGNASKRRLQTKDSVKGGRDANGAGIVGTRVIPVNGLSVTALRVAFAQCLGREPRRAMCRTKMLPAVAKVLGAGGIPIGAGL